MRKSSLGWRTGAALGAVFVLALLLPGPAGASVSKLSSSPGAQYPDITVDGNGTSHVVWLQSGAGVFDDDIVYCRVPRGANTCAATHHFGFSGSAGPPKINLMPNGRLVVAAEFYGEDPGHTDADSKVYAITSDNGGASWSQPAVLANLAGTIWGWIDTLGGEIEPGPGYFDLSLVGNSGGCNQGVHYTDAPLGSTTTGGALLTADCNKSFSPSLAFLDPTTPIAAYSNGDRLYYRRYDGSGDYNSASNWGPETKAPFAAGDPRLAGGPRGVFLIHGKSGKPGYWARRYDGQSNTFGKPTRITDRSANSRDLFEDGTGTMHAVFTEQDHDSNWQLTQAVLPPGKDWQSPKKLTHTKAYADFYNLRVGASPLDAGGAVVADHNGSGPIWFAPFGPTAGSAVCPPSVKVGEAVVRALKGCFAKGKGGVRVATGPVKVNGIDIEPTAGASAAAAFKVTVDRRRARCGPTGWRRRARAR